MKKTINITLMGICIALNILGSFIAVTLKLPIYMDSIGTILVAGLLGPKLAVVTGLCGSIISGLTFDVYSLYFAPVQITTGYLAGIMFQKQFLKGKKLLFGVAVFAVPTSIISAIIAAYVFGGVTSAGSSYIVQILSTFNVPMVVGVFVTQIITDYSDKLIAVLLVNLIIKNMPKNIKSKICS